MKKFRSPLDATLHVKVWKEPTAANPTPAALRAGIFTYDDDMVCELHENSESSEGGMTREETKNQLSLLGYVLASDWTQEGGDDRPWTAAIVPREEAAIIPASLQERAGDDFMEAIKLAVEKRVERRNQYGDSYKVDELLYQFYLARAKLMRFRTQLSTDGDWEEVRNQETALDSLVDSICYTAFAVEGLVKRHMNNEKGSAA